MPRVLVEACVETITDALAAQDAGADRIELCVSLHEGGVTPSAGLIAACSEALAIPVHVLVRPRAGDFVYGAREVDICLRDIAAAKTAGAAAVVVGALTAQGTLDLPRLADFVRAARPLTVGVHRAFDGIVDQAAALEQLVTLGVDVVLTSGRAPTAMEGADRLKALVTQAAGRIQVLAGGKVSVGNVRPLVARTGVPAVHARAFSGLAAALA
jgi:copper homeostasis protein